ncbi:MAG: peptidylprolyl isomerase [Candidatus Omnitrophica bacterium]|nr:peptidylprolyl isomerase [Candidatus Omnitrophota bacterium]
MDNQVISFEYVLTGPDGAVIDASLKGKPLTFMTGKNQIIPGLESVLSGMNPQENKTVTLKATEAYGEYNPKLIYKVNIAKLPAQEIKVGDVFEIGKEGHFFPVAVSALNGEEVTLDGNHPLAGKDLIFAVKVVEKRPATSQEASHGHVHGGVGCCQCNE